MPHTSSQAPMVSGSGRYVEPGAVAGAHRPQTSDLISKKMSPDGFSTCKQYDAPLSNLMGRKKFSQLLCRHGVSLLVCTGFKAPRRWLKGYAEPTITSRQSRGESEPCRPANRRVGAQVYLLISLLKIASAFRA